MITVTTTRKGPSTEEWCERMLRRTYLAKLEKYGPIGVTALQKATPVEHGATAAGWTYEIIQRKGYFSIQWLNTHTEEPGHIPVAVLIQYGHGTRNGGYVEGIDYINPAMKPIFEQIVADMWEEVTK